MSFVPFSEIIGQNRAIQFLKQVLAQKKLSHAYLFVGIPGVGKTTTAVAWAQAINCQEPQNGEGCGDCISCRQFISRSYPDLEIIAPDGQVIGIEQIRNIDRSMSFKPLSGKHRVVIIRQAEMMTQEAANAFLKTLEEPPRGNILILNVTEPLDLLLTVVSRCQKVPFRPVPAPLVAEWLMKKKNEDPKKATLLAKIAEGSPGKALTMEEGGYLEKRQACISGLMGLPDVSEPETLELALRYTGKEKRKVQDDEEGEKREKGEKSEIPLLIGIWKTWYRDMMLIKTHAPPDFLINEDLSLELKKTAQAFTMNNLISSFLALDQAENDFLHSRNLDLLMENLLLTLKGLMVENDHESGLREHEP